MTAEVYTNELEQQFSRLPGFLQSVLRTPFEWVDNVVKDIAGNPQELTSAGTAYAALGKKVSSLAPQQAQDRASILSGAWSGSAYESFSASMSQVEQQIATLGQATTQTQPLLDAAAQACTQSANVIVEIVEGVISFALQDAVVSGVLSLFTFGAAAAAGAAAAVAKFADACSQIGGIVARLTTVLEKIASLLVKLSEVCTKVVEYLKDLKTALEAAKGLKGWLGKGALVKLQRTGINVAVRGIVGYGVDGGSIPGIVGGTVHAGLAGAHAIGDVQQADDQGN